MIFVNEDPGFEAGQKPSGHVRLEVREGRGKLHATVQNLKPGYGRFVYKLYLLRVTKGGVTAANAGELAAESNKSELEWSFDPANVGASGCGIEEFCSAVVVVEYAGRSIDSIVCPLAAYKNNKLEWRSSLRAELMKKRVEKLPGEEYIHPNRTDHIELLPRKEQYNICGTERDVLQSKELPGNIAQPEQHLQQNIKQLNQEPPYQGLPNQELLCEEPSYQKQLHQGQPNQELPNQEQLYQQQAQEQSQFDQTQQMPAQFNQIQQTEPYQQQPAMLPQNQTTAQYQVGIGQIDTGCVYLNGNMCGAFVNNSTSAANPCDACRMHHAQVPAAVPPAGDVSQLKEEIGRYFEESDPFHSKRSDYIWWKVTNPVNLNNILYQCNIRSPLLFNPAVMMAHYKYRHLIIGIFQHREGQKQYVVCGVPGMHMVDRKPFGEMSRWVQAEGNRSRYGAFGYWLVYIDPDDGKILNMG